jgi:hypothetical protein
MNNTKVLDVNPIIITWSDEAPQNVNISRIGDLQNGYYFGPMNHNTIWKNSMSKATLLR